MEDVMKTRNELLVEVSRMNRARHRVRMAGLELLLEQTRIQSLLRESSDAIVVFNAEARIQLFSRGAETLFGCDELDLFHRPLDSIISCPAEFAGDVPRYLAHLCDSHADALQQPLEAFSKSGEKLLLSFSLSLVSMDQLMEDEVSIPSGDYQAAMCIFHEITAQIQAPEERPAHPGDPDRLVQEILEPLGKILDQAKTASSLEGAVSCPKMLQALQGIHHTAGDMVQWLSQRI